MSKTIQASANKKCIVLLLLLCLPSLSFSYDGDPVTNAVKDLGHLRGLPECMHDRANLYLAGGLLGTAIILAPFDKRLLDAIQKNKTRTMKNLSKNAEKFGNGAYEIPALGVVAGAGYVFKNEKLKDTSLIGMESFLTANAIGTALKFAVGRSRPYEGTKTSFAPFSFNNRHASFPSGHTVSAFSIASVFATRYDSLLVGGVAYGLATTVALQRMYTNNHWPTDVLFGAFLGTVTGQAVVRFTTERYCKVASIAPVYQPGFSGMTATVKF